MGIRPVNRGVVKDNEYYTSLLMREGPTDGHPAREPEPIRRRTDYIRHASLRPRGVPDSPPCSEPPMPCRKGTAGGNASLCFWVGFV